MPIGVPQIPYPIPDDDEEKDEDKEAATEEEEEATEEEEEEEEEEKKQQQKKKRKKKKKEEIEWLDLYQHLADNRIIFLSGDIEDEITNHVCGLILHLSELDPTEDVHLYINSSGGKILNGLAIYDCMQYAEADVSTTCVGSALSTASMILAGGEITKRVAFPHARIMIHQPSTAGFVKARTSDCIEEAKQILKIREQVTRIYHQRTGKPLEVLWKNMERSYYMSAEEAKSYGIIDSIGASLK